MPTPGLTTGSPQTDTCPAKRAAQKLPNDPQAFASAAQSLGTEIQSGGTEIGTVLGGTISVAFHPSGKRLASTSLDQSICIWDTESLEILAELTGHDNAVTCVAYSPEGKWLASGGEDRTLRLWTEAGVEVVACELESQVVSLAFSANGQFIFTGNANTTCCQLNVADLLRG